jgi:uncharacterized protein YndB with AHSA1/START domain
VTVRIELCTDLPAAPGAVWAAIADIDRHTEWMADAERITFVTDRREGVGTTFDCHTAVGFLRTTDRMTVTEWVPGEVMGIEHRGAVRGVGRFTLAPARDGTHFCWSEQLTFPWWLGGRIGEVLGRPVLKFVWRRNLDRLRTWIARREVNGRGTAPSPDRGP